MKVHIDCLPCAVRQAVDAAKLVTEDEKQQFTIVKAIWNRLSEVTADHTSPELGRIVHGAVAKEAGVNDPYHKLKARDIANALEILPRLRQAALTAEDPLRSAILVSAMGNVIDAAVTTEVDVNALVQTVKSSALFLDDHEHFARELLSAKRVVIVGDNAGESVLDRVLIEMLEGVEVVYAVREAPAINDVTLNDAEASGLIDVCRVISSGCDAPGLILTEATPDFLNIFNSADIVISKGQGNYEALSENPTRPIYFLLKAKCPVIAGEFGVPLGELLFVRKEPTRNS